MNEVVRRPGDSLKLEQQHAEWARHEAMMLAINDPGTPEGGVSERALKRLDELVTEMDLEPGMMRMAHQVRPLCLPLVWSSFSIMGLRHHGSVDLELHKRPGSREKSHASEDPTAQQHARSNEAKPRHSACRLPRS